MEIETTKTRLQKIRENITIKKTLKWVGITLGALYILLVLIRIPYVITEEKTIEQVEKIHSSKITLADVMGENLPPNPGNQADVTVEGIDVNNNGIRDDVELAIFKEYLHSARARAVMLQYAHALQMEMTTEVVNEETVIAVAQEGMRASGCIGSSVSRDDLETYFKITDSYVEYVENRQINTEARSSAVKEFYKHIGSHSELEGEDCDLKLDELPN